jgi:hypothetical protein
VVSRRRKKKVEVEALIRPVPIDVGTAVAPGSDHKHQYVRVGAIRDDEFMEQCMVCADMRRV